ncbi:MAG: helix-turn-helix domain-containing protein [Alistipes sp.]|nr:helix-turn-helix domain-containing protein [Alistipes senegalensis]MCM1250720.1 helix-turn-helix domain-containing protein [Alistipes sp.]
MNLRQQETASPITNFSLSELIGMSGNGNRPAREFIIAHSDASHLKDFQFPCRIDAFIIGIGSAGRTEVSINLNEYRLQRNTLFLIGPQSIVQTAPGGTLEGDVIIVSSRFLQRINIDSKQLMPLMLQLGTHPSIEITDEESRQLRAFIALMETESRTDAAPFSEQVVSELFLALLYKMGNTLQRYLTAHPEVDERIHSRAETYFRRFLQVLSEHYKEERSVGFYARQLCITPKYLTTLVKRISSKSVSEWIEIYVVLEAKMLLKYSGLSIQEIAYTLNFPNQSFFGSYFKRHTGMSPSQYKASDGTNDEGGGYFSDVSDNGNAVKRETNGDSEKSCSPIG